MSRESGRGETWLRWGFLSVWIVFFGACSAHRFDYRLPIPVLDASASPMILEFMEEDRQESQRVQDALQKAMDKVSRWGNLPYPTTIKVYPSHQSLLLAVRRFGLDWLRGWACFDTVYLQSPRTWVIPDRQKRLEELLTHELAHVLTYQQASTPENWHDLALPFWFREGFASVVAEQGERRGTKKHVKSYYLSETFVGDPLLQPEKVMKDQPAMAYAIAHWCFHDLLAHIGKERILAVFEEMRQGRRFRRAFYLATGLYADNWVEGWRESLVLGVPFEPIENHNVDSILPLKDSGPEPFNAVPDMGPVHPKKQS